MNNNEWQATIRAAQFNPDPLKFLRSWSQNEGDIEDACRQLNIKYSAPNGHGQSNAIMPIQAEKKAKSPTHDELRDEWLTSVPPTAYGLGEWRRYSNGIWVVTSEAVIEKELEEVIEAKKNEGIRPAHHVLSSVLKLARVEVSIPDEQWNRDSDILVCKNGTLNIPTMTLREHRKEDYATSGLSFDYDPTEQCPTFIWAIQSAIPDAEEFLQEFAGYCLTTSTRYEMALWFHGPRGCGKSTIIGGITSMLDERADILSLADIERSSFALTNLPGKTLVTATEQPGSYIRSIYTLNSIISGEPIQVDIKYRNPVKITPHAKIIWAMHDLPRIPSAGDGIFRRVKVLGFPARPEADRDPQVKDEISKEGAGILNWALVGLKRLNERKGFNIPECVRDATKDFEEQNDVVGSFVSEMCVTGPEYKSQGDPLYMAYQNWCVSNGNKAMSKNNLAQEWKRLGFDKHMSNGRAFWHGIGMRDGA